MEDNEEMDREGSENENEAGEEGDNKETKEYVKKEFFAKPYTSKFGNASENEVRSLTTKNQRTLMKIRVSRPRKEFGLDGHSFIEREAAGESSTEIKITKTGYFTKKKVLEIGLQAAN